jgi:hypothetical protein
MRQTFEDLAKVAIERYKDKNFCTVAALALSLDWSYGKAHRHMKRYGRKQRCGMRHADWFPAITDAVHAEGKSIRELSDRAFYGMTIGRFAKVMAQGTYYVTVRGHALCIRDGVLHDWTADTAARRRIKIVYKVEG